MTGEEKFQVDLEGYLVIKNVLTQDEVAEMNAIIDSSDRQGPPSLWGEPFKQLIDHRKILPYLIELLGPHVRLDHDYSLFMEKGQGRGGLHGGEDGGRAGGRVGDHWYKYRDGHMRNGLSVMTYIWRMLLKVPVGSLVFQGAISATSRLRFHKRCDGLSVLRTMLCNRRLKPGMCSFLLKHSFTGRCRGQRIMNVGHCFINIVRDIRHGQGTTTTPANMMG